MVFDAAFRPEKQPSGATQESSSLFNRIHDEHVGIRLASAQGGALEPPGQGVIEPPPPTKIVERPVTINNNHNNLTAKGGDAHSTSNATSNAAATSGSRSDTNISTRNVYTAPPSFGGGECSTGVSGGALGFALGFQTPNMDCIREKTGAQKEGQTLDFTVSSGTAAANIIDQALAHVDKARDFHRQGADGVAQAHLQGANAQKQISGHLANESVVAAEKVLGPGSAGPDAGGWNASILNDNSPPPAAEAPRPVHRDRPHPPKPVAHVVKEADCPEVKH